MMHLILLDKFDYLFCEHNEIKIDPELELKNKRKILFYKNEK